MTRIHIRLASVLAALSMLLLLAAGCGTGGKKGAEGQAGAPSAGPPGTPGTMAPPYQLADLDGKLVSSSEFAGKVVILDFWATWCPPCKAEIPHFNALQAKYGSQGLVIVGLSLDAEGASKVKEFMKENPIDYTMLIGTDETAKAYGGIVSIPTTFVIDRQGKIAQRFIGFMAPEVFEQAIAPLLATTS